MVGTLFLTFCDVEMGKIVTEQLSKQVLNMGEMRAQVRNLESSPWYKGPKGMAKVAGAGSGAGLEQGGGEGGDQRSVKS